MKKILFVNDEMVMGGVSKVLNNLLTHIDTEKYEVSLLVLHCHGEMLKDVPPQIKVIKGTSFFDVIDTPIEELIKEKKWGLVFKKIKLFLLMRSGLINYVIFNERQKMNLCHHDVEIAFKEGFCSVFVGCGESDIKINWVHADYKVMNYAKNYMQLMRRVLNKFTYHVAVSKVAASSFEEVFNLEQKVLVIHNIIEAENIIGKADEEICFRDELFSFISVGRLHPQKSYDRLVNACDKLKKDGYVFKVYIIGNGELEQKIKKQISSLSLEDTVILLGSQSNPFKYLKQADCFVLSSIYEGLPTVVFESMILKVPVLALEVAGVQEQLQNKYGIITRNDEEHLYLEMKRILDNPSILEIYKNHLKHYQYDNEKILSEIYDMFE
ncbi:MAG: glycosyltransferase [Erysipelotrichaceae bacterium]